MRKAQTAAMAHVAKVVTAAQAAMRNILDSELNSVRESGTWKSERIIVTSQGPLICVEGGQQPVLNFCANNYLGLSVSCVHTLSFLLRPPMMLCFTWHSFVCLFFCLSQLDIELLIGSSRKCYQIRIARQLMYHYIFYLCRDLDIGILRLFQHCKIGHFSIVWLISLWKLIRSSCNMQFYQRYIFRQRSSC